MGWRWSHWEQGVTVLILKMLQHWPLLQWLRAGFKHHRSSILFKTKTFWPRLFSLSVAGSVVHLLLWYKWLGQWVLAAAKNEWCKKQQSPCVMPVCSGADSAHVHLRTCMVALLSNKCNLIKNANTWQSKQKRQCSVGSRALVSKSEGPILPGVCRVTLGKSTQRSALLVPPVN